MSDPYSCQICGECAHVVLVGASGLTLLCGQCHMAIHRWFGRNPLWQDLLTLDLKCEFARTAMMNPNVIPATAEVATTVLGKEIFDLKNRIADAVAEWVEEEAKKRKESKP